jgi:hypothetical protein
MKGSGMPQMSAAFGGWAQRVTFVRRVQQIVDDGLVSYNDVAFTFRGTVQPLSPKQISLKPEGQRAWEWLQVHCFSNAQLEPNDQIVYNGKIFKVMGKLDYSLNGYVEYHLVADYQ